MGSTWVDMRWCEQGWREAFRIRLSGWLPDDWLAGGIKHGVLAQCRGELSATIKLTEKGKLLTDICPDKTTHLTIQFMASVLTTTHTGPEWFNPSPSQDHAYLLTDEMFDKEYTAKLAALCHDSMSPLERVR
jgi:hypothetical protein